MIVCFEFLESSVQFFGDGEELGECGSAVVLQGLHSSAPDEIFGEDVDD